MTLQARLSHSDSRFYNANRDLAHCFGGAMKEVADRMEGKRWPSLAVMLDASKVTEDDLGQACEACLLFVASATEFPKERMADALERCGWWKVPPPAQVGIMATLGTVMLGYFFAGARDATIGGEGPAASLQDLRWVGARTAKLLSMPRWRRPIAVFWERAKLAWRVMTGTL